jgi:hypothetical protein
MHSLVLRGVVAAYCAIELLACTQTDQRGVDADTGRVQEGAPVSEQEPARPEPAQPTEEELATPAAPSPADAMADEAAVDGTGSGGSPSDSTRQVGDPCAYEGDDRCVVSEAFPHGYWTWQCASDEDCGRGNRCDCESSPEQCSRSRTGFCRKPCTSDDDCKAATKCLVPGDGRQVRYCKCFDPECFVVDEPIPRVAPANQ